MVCHLLSATTYPNTVVEYCLGWCPFPEHPFRRCEALRTPLRWLLDFILLGTCGWHRWPLSYIYPPPFGHELLPLSNFPVSYVREKRRHVIHMLEGLLCVTRAHVHMRLVHVPNPPKCFNCMERVPCMFQKIFVVTIPELAVGGKLAAHP
jgi:hypothetical protein